MFRCIQVALTFTLLNTFTYTQEAAEKILIQPWIDCLVPRRFVGVATNSNVTPALTNRLQKHRFGNCNAHGHLQKLDSFNRGLGTDLIQAARQYTMGLRYARVVWDCHFTCIHDAAGDTVRGCHTSETNDTVLVLWHMSCRQAANLVMVLVNLARNGEEGPEIAVASGGQARLKEARYVAESSIGFLKNKPTWANARIGETEQAQTAVSNAKALMCFRAHIVCKGLGDVDAAIAYLREAITYELETEENVKRIEDLEAVRASIVGENVSAFVRWAN
jgi:hypothetical protein